MHGKDDKGTHEQKERIEIDSQDKMHNTTAQHIVDPRSAHDPLQTEIQQLEAERSSEEQADDVMEGTEVSEDPHAYHEHVNRNANEGEQDEIEGNRFSFEHHQRQDNYYYGKGLGDEAKYEPEHPERLIEEYWHPMTVQEHHTIPKEAELLNQQGNVGFSHQGNVQKRHVHGDHGNIQKVNRPAAEMNVSTGSHANEGSADSVNIDDAHETT